MMELTIAVVRHSLILTNLVNYKIDKYLYLQEVHLIIHLLSSMVIP